MPPRAFEENLNILKIQFESLINKYMEATEDKPEIDAVITFFFASVTIFFSILSRDYVIISIGLFLGLWLFLVGCVAIKKVARRRNVGNIGKE